MPLIDIADLSSLVEALKSHNPGIPFSGRTEITYRFLTSTSGPGQFNAADFNEIHLGTRSVLEYLLSPVQKAFHEAARER